MRVGQGYDIHRLSDVIEDNEQNNIALGGILIPFNRTLIAHSDGDVVLHALCDALLGALALGDIGSHFPDTDPKFKNVSSDVFLSHALKQVLAKGYHVQNVDVTVITEKPKLRPYIDAMRHRVSQILEIEIDNVSIKAKTNEALDSIGAQQAIAAQAIALLVRNL